MTIKLNSEIKSTKLQNGVVVATESIPSAYSCSMGIWIDVGSRDETHLTNGISHLFEHMVFKGCENYTGYEIVKILESGGGQVNAFTTKEQTCFYAKVAGHKALEGIRILLEMVFKPTLSSQDLLKERDVIIEELRGSDDSPEELVYDVFSKALYGDKNMGLPIAGTVSSVRQLKISQLQEHLRQVQTELPVYVIASGNINHDEILKIVENISPSTSTYQRSVDRSVLPDFHQKNVLIHKDVQQVNVVLGGKGTPIEDKTCFALLVLNEIVGDGMSSRLFQRLREDLGYVYHINSFTEFHINNGLFCVSFSTEPTLFEKVMLEIFKIFKSLKSDGITEEELNFSKDNIRGSFLMDMESIQSKMVFLSRLKMRGQSIDSHEKYLRAVEAVQLSDVRNIINTLFDPQYWSIASVVPTGFKLPKNFKLNF